MSDATRTDGSATGQPTTDDAVVVFTVGLPAAALATDAGLVVRAGMADAGEPVDVVVVGPDAAAPLAAVQQAHATHPDASVVLVVPRNDPDGVRRAVTYTPGVPADLEVLVEGETDLVARVRAAGARAQRLRHHRTLLEALQSQPTGGRLGARPAQAPLGTLLDHAPLGVVVVQDTGELLSWNARAAAMLGITADDAGRSVTRLVADPATIADLLRRVTHGDGTAPVLAADVLVTADVTLELSAVPTQLEDGRAAVLVLVLDVSERRAAELARDELSARLRVVQRSQEFLLRASDVLAGATGYEETLRRLAAVAVPTLGDLCLIDVVDDDGALTRMAATHADPALQHLADELRRRYAPSPDGPHPSADVVATRQTRWAPVMSDEFLRAMARDEEHFQLVKRLGFTSYITVPLIADDDVLGSVTVVSAGSGRRFDADDVAVTEELAGRVAQVVAKARRYEREHRIAEALQHSMLTALPRLDGMEVAARYVPARDDTQVGGDWYDAFVSAGGTPVVVIGDVVGHDLEAAGRMGQLRNALRGLSWGRADRPAVVLAALDAFTTSLEIADFATVVYGALRRTPTGDVELLWSNAGHLPPLVVEPDGTARFLDEDSDLLVGAPVTFPRTDHRTVLEPGATLLLYTDGLVERRADQLDTGLDDLQALAAGLAGLPVEDMCDRVVAALAPDADDDVALLVLRVL